MIASYRAKMLCGSYILQANRARFNQNKVNPTCPLCKSAPEDLPHFLLSCSALDPPRSKFLNKIKSIAYSIGTYLSTDPVTQCKNILNAANPDSCCACSGRSKRSRVSSKCKCAALNELINSLCLTLHNHRSQVLSQLGKDTK